MLAPWVIEEMKTVDLFDKRLNERLRTVLSQLAARPTASIPAACGGNAEMTAAYRLFDNEKTTFDNVLEPHVNATRQRIAAQTTVIVLPPVSLPRCGRNVARRSSLTRWLSMASARM